MKPYQLVTVDAGDYRYVGQVISYPIDQEFIMVRRVPEDPATMEKMKISSLTPVDTKYHKYRYIHYAAIEGVGTFPVDMLRYDMAAPVNFKFVEDRWGDLTKVELTTQDYGDKPVIACVSEHSKPDWTDMRWASFLYHVKRLQTVRITGKL